MRLSVVGLLACSFVASCSSDDPTGNPNIVRFVAIQGSDPMSIGAFGALQLTAFALDANHVEVPPNTFSMAWSSLNPAVATVISGGLVTVHANGTAEIIAKVGAAADTITLVVQQVASKITFDQDTAVALMQGATRLSGDVLAHDTMYVSAHRADANDNPVAGSAGGAIVWSSGSALLTVVPMAGTDSAKIIGTAPGSGTLSAAIPGLATATMRFQVADQYAVVRMFQPNATGATTQLTPSTVTIPAGAAVVFRSADQEVHGAVSSAGHWKTALLAGPNGVEAQLFTVAGSHDYKVENTTGTVVVQ